MTGWVGWSVFAATMMIIGGSLNALYGLVAIVNDDWVVWRNTTAVYFDLSTWGWVQLVVGVLVALAGVGVLTGNVVARAVGVLMAGLSMLANFFFIPVYPFWSITIITVDALVIWALTAHGSELRRASRSG
jgi:hypothetical protein